MNSQAVTLLLFNLRISKNNNAIIFCKNNDIYINYKNFKHDKVVKKTESLHQMETTIIVKITIIVKLNNILYKSLFMFMMDI